MCGIAVVGEDRKGFNVLGGKERVGLSRREGKLGALELSRRHVRWRCAVSLQPVGLESPIGWASV